MKVIFTDQSLQSLEEVLFFLIEEQQTPIEQVRRIKDNLLDHAEQLAQHPYAGQREEYLEHLNLDHRRLIENHIKIIYRVEAECVYITDFFDSRQHPSKMKS